MPNWYEFRLIFNEAEKAKTLNLKRNYRFIKEELLPLIRKLSIKHYHFLNYFEKGKRDYMRFRAELDNTLLSKLKERFSEIIKEGKLVNFEFKEWSPKIDSEKRVESAMRRIELAHFGTDGQWQYEPTCKQELVQAFETYLTKILGQLSTIFIKELNQTPRNYWLLSLFIHLFLNSITLSGPDRPTEEYIIRNFPVF